MEREANNQYYWHDTSNYPYNFNKKIFVKLIGILKCCSLTNLEYWWLVRWNTETKRGNFYRIQSNLPILNRKNIPTTSCKKKQNENPKGFYKYQPWLGTNLVVFTYMKKQIRLSAYVTLEIWIYFAFRNHSFSQHLTFAYFLIPDSFKVINIKLLFHRTKAAKFSLA